ncbi:PUA-like domain-containing protein [Cytidiella melzeri]|nr:PUA-like domain-containing protein [Cytidiella melzeri]
MVKADHPAAKFGHIPGINVGHWWPSRKECSADYVHPGFLAGIYGRKDDGARSVVLSKSEFADKDYGETFIYVGSGGRAPGQRVGPQTEDQSFKNNLNQALARSAFLKKPVRVIRGPGGSKYAPYDGFRYDGLYQVSNPRIEKGEAGFNICLFDFKREPNQPPLPTDRGPRDKSDIAARRRQYRQLLGTSKPGPSKSKRPTHRAASSSADEEENLESLFTSPEEVEEELEPVLSQLARFTRSGGSSAEKKARRGLLVEVGRHIKAVVKEKEEEGQDAAWWRHELWSYVVKATPGGKRDYTVQQYEELYEKYEGLQALQENFSTQEAG